jgi:hypothetical protein
LHGEQMRASRPSISRWKPRSRFSGNAASTSSTECR